MRKKILSLLIVCSILLPVLATPIIVSATDVFGVNWVGNNIALKKSDPRGVAAQVINVVLTLLGIVAVVIVLLGGFKWMTAGGNEEKVGDAKKLLGAGVIGLVIILAAWGIATFVLEQLMKATNY